MRVAFSYWGDRIAPVFDTAEHLRVLELENGRILRESVEEIPGDSPMEKLQCLQGLGIEVLVCGAISRGLEAVVLSAGVEVISFIAGDLTQVTEAWRAGRLPAAEFAMPGCVRRCCRGCCSVMEGGVRRKVGRCGKEGSGDSIQ